MDNKDPNSFNHDKFAYRLNAILYDRGMTRAELARKTGLDQGQVTKYFRQNLYPNVEALIKISKELNVSIDYLLGLDLDVKRIASDIKNIAVLQKGSSSARIVEKAEEIIYKYSGAGED